jgi:virginiamycin B lyase
VPDALLVPRDVTAAGASTIKASPSPDWAVAAAGGVWVSGVGPGLQRYDATTGAVTGELAIYSVCSAMDQGFGSVWAMSCDYGSPKLVRIDAATGASTAEIPMPARLPAESSVGAGEGAVWLLTSGSPRQLLAVDPGTNTVARTLPAPEGATAVRAGLGAVWVPVATPGQVVRIDPASGQVVATINVGPNASFLAVGPDAVWVRVKDDALAVRIDPQANAGCRPTRSARRQRRSCHRRYLGLDHCARQAVHLAVASGMAARSTGEVLSSYLGRTADRAPDHRPLRGETSPSPARVVS